MMTKHFSCLCIIVALFLMVSISSFATSVYTIGHSGGPWTHYCPLNAFDIVNDQIVFQGNVDLPMHGYGGIDVAFDKLTNTLFVSFENGEYGGGNIIEIVDATTLQNIARTIEGVTDLTSIVFDTETRELYATDRNTNLLHVLSWNPAQKMVSLEKTIELENIDYACGLVINDDLLYVSEFHYSTSGNMTYYSGVNCYRISEDFAFVETVDMGDKTVALGYESAANTLYGGAYAYNGDYHHLIKYPLDDPNDLIQKDLGAGMVGIACDDTVAGRVFLTTYRNHGIENKEYYGSIEMWDTADWQAEPNTLPITEVTAIYDDTNTDGTNLTGLSGLVVIETPKPPQIQIVKRDDVETCISPESADPNFVYTIGISDPNGHENIWLVDYLPREVDFVSAWPADPNYGYNLETHTYTWFVPSIDGYDPDDPNSIPGGDPNAYFALTVRVNGWAEPMSRFTNTATVESDTAYDWTATETDVCCWGGNVIYVVPQAVEDTGYINFGGIETTWATGRNTGTSWSDAYQNLPEALARAAKGCGSEIWVAGGIYRPADTVLTKTFEIPAGVSVYGGFAGNETSLDQRNILKYPTVLSGYIDETTRSNTVVTMAGNGALLDGFIVKEGYLEGINGSGVSSTVANCVVNYNTQKGLFCENGNLTVQWCEIKENGEQGIQHEGSSYELTIENCNIHDNQQDGIKTISSTSTILNSLIYLNGLEVSPYKYYGINLNSPYSGPAIRNNTIVQNVNEGIRRSGGSLPDIVNCIVYYNGGDVPLVGLDPDEVAYNSCIADCNEVNSNINDEPGFAYTTKPNNLPVMGNYHLAYDSPCVDTGDSDEYTDELDADGEPRVYGNWVDRGADEAYSCNDEYLTEDDIYNPLDFSADGIINYEEFSVFAPSWLVTEPNALFNPRCDFYKDGTIDLADLEVFCDEWLWMACWRQNQFELYGMMAMSGGGGMQMVLPAQELLSTQAVYEPTSYTETDLVHEAESLIQILDFLEGLIGSETDNIDTILEMKSVLEEWLEEIDLE